MGDEIFDLGVKNEALREKIGEADEIWLNDSKYRIKLTYNNDKNNKFILERIKRQSQKMKAI
jgi:hypothetical protein